MRTDAGDLPEPSALMGSRVKMVPTDPQPGPLGRSQIVKGYEIEKGPSGGERRKTAVARARARARARAGATTATTATPKTPAAKKRA